MSSIYDIRQAAALSGQIHYTTGKPCKRGHIAPRYTTSGACTQCVVLKVMHRRQGNNTALPPSPYIFPGDTKITPELVSYVHARVLEGIPALCREYEETYPLIADKVAPGMTPSQVAGLVYRARFGG